VIEIRQEPLGSGRAHVETVYALGDSEADAIHLVRTARQLSDESVRIITTLSEAEIAKIGLKPYQVRSAA
jgi:hypothetical protein